MRTNKELSGLVTGILVAMVISLGGMTPAVAKDLPGASQTSYGVSPNGAFSFRIPIVVPRGRNGVQPNLSLAFSSGSGNGSVGVGWGVGGLSSITRCGRTFATDGVAGGVLHNANDRFCLNGKRLKLISGGTYGGIESEYRTEIDEISKVIGYGAMTNLNGGTSPTNFKVWRKDGMVMEYGNTTSSRFRITNNSIHAWKLNKAQDRNGNSYTVTYEQDYRLLSSISYDGGHTISFAYGGRTDVRESYILGKKIIRDERLDSITVKKGTTTVRQYDLAYQYAPVTEKSRLVSITECGLNSNNCLPSIAITWKAETAGFRDDTSALERAPHEGVDFSMPDVPDFTIGSFREEHYGTWADVNGDGRVDQVIAVKLPDGTQKLLTYIKTDTGWQEQSAWRLDKPLRNYQVAAATGFSGFSPKVINQGQLIDVNGDGLVDVVYSYTHHTNEDQNNYGAQIRRTFINNGSTFVEDPTYKLPDYLYSYVDNLAEGPTNDQYYVIVERGRLVDINGDGLVDFLVAYHKDNPGSPTTASSYPSEKKVKTYINDGSKFVYTSSYNMPDVFTHYKRGRPVENGVLVDLNGDGLLDWARSTTHPENSVTSLPTRAAWLNSGTGFIRNDAYKLPDVMYESTNWAVTTNKASMVDVNGDGLRDYVRSYSIGYGPVSGTYLNTGFGFKTTQEVSYNTPFTHIDTRDVLKPVPSPMYVSGSYIDLNRDGLVDFAEVHRDDDGAVVNNIWKNTGSGWVQDNTFQLSSTSTNWLINDNHGRTNAKVRQGQFVDINNDGSPDWVKFRADKTIDSKINQVGKPDHVAGITTTSGVTITPTFKPLTDSGDLYTKGTIGTEEADSRHVAGPMYVTSQLDVTNPIGTDNTTRYKYTGAQAHRKGRGFLGFKTFTTINDATGLTQVEEYRQDYPFIGFTKTSTLREKAVTNSSVWLSKTTDGYATKSLNGGKTKYPHLSSRTTQTRELNSNGAAQFSWSSSTVHTVDDYGNVLTSTADNGLNSSATPLLTGSVTNVFKPAITSTWLVGRLSTTTSVQTEPNDPSNAKTRKTEYTYHSNEPWLIENVIREPNSGDNSVKLTTTYSYDAYGNVTQEKVTSPDTADPNRIRINGIDYDADYRLPTSLTNAEGHVSTITYNSACDQPDVVTDINQLTTTYTYDNFCRQDTVTDALGIIVDIDYDFSPSCTNCEYSVKSSRKRAGANIESPVTVFYNRFSQPTLSRTTGVLFTQVIEQETAYDNLGRVIEQSQPRFTGDVEQLTRYDYDLINRPVLTTLPYAGRGATGKAIIEYEYAVVGGQQKRTTRNTLNHATEVFANALGQIEKIHDAKTGILTYDYDAQSNLVQTEAMGNSATRITVEYDKLGRREQLIDPDLGTSSYTYDAFGQLATQTDAKGNVLSMEYDRLGRLEKRHVLAAGQTTPETSLYSYDVDPTGDTAAKALGRISSIKRGTTVQEDERYFTYDTLGRPEGQVTYIKGERFEEAYTYNVDGQLDSRAYPSSGFAAVDDGNGGTTNVAQNFKVAYEYENGYLVEISGVDEDGHKCITHWKANEYDALGRTKVDTLGEIVTTTRTYDQAQGVLERIHSVLQVGDGITSFSGDSVQDISYGYDDNNNLLSRSDAISSVNETFAYDELDRLTSYSRTGNEAVTVGYDPLGNITYKSDVGDYQYNGSRPHAVTKVTARTYQNQQTTDPLAKFTIDWEWNGETITNAQPSIHDTTYQYDANGNITAQGERLFTWTAFDKPSAMLRGNPSSGYTGSLIEYNADFNRNYKQEGTFSTLGVMTELKETTYYVGKEYEKIVNSEGTIHRYTIQTGGGTIQIEREDGTVKDKPMYMLGDHLGSVNVILNALGNVEQRLEFDPWGMRVAGPEVGVVNSITNRGYTGHEMDDEVGVINMNARIYDPLLGRFLSADPVLQDPYNLASFNRYSYTWNNPFKYVDPSGNSNICNGEQHADQCRVVGSGIIDELTYLCNDLGICPGGGESDSLANEYADRDEAQDRLEEYQEQQGTAQTTSVNSDSADSQNTIDTNGDGNISPTEFIEAAVDEVAENFVPLLRDTFQRTRDQYPVIADVYIEASGVEAVFESGVSVSEGDFSGAAIAGAGVLVGKVRAADAAADALSAAKEGGQKVFHFTDEAGARAIKESGVIKPDAKGRVFVTKDKVSASEANNALFMGRGGSKGSHRVEIELNDGTKLNRGSQPNELIHNGSIRSGRQGTIEVKDNDF